MEGIMLDTILHVTMRLVIMEINRVLFLIYIICQLFSCKNEKSWSFNGI